MATRVSAVGAAGNWTSGSAWVGGVAPTSADDAVLQATTTSMTIDAGAVCRSLTATAFTGTLTHTAGVALSIGDGTAGSGNVALAFGTFTYTLGNVATSAISFISTSATTQTVNFNGKTTGNVTFNAASGGSWQYTGGHVTGSTAIVTLTKGTLDINGQTCNWGKFDSANTNTRSLTLGAANIECTFSSGTAFDLSNNTGFTFSGASANITISGAGGNLFVNGKTIGSVTATGGATKTISNNGGTFGTLTFTGSNAKTDNYKIATCTVTGTFTCNGNSSINRLLLSASTVGTASTVTAGTVSISNSDLMDITGAGLADWDFNARTDIGDCGGNSNIIFPDSVSQTWNGASGGNWSTNAWTTRVPLPQDDVSLSVAFSASQTVTADMPRLGRSIVWTGATGSPTWAFNSVANAIYGSVTLISGMTISGTQVLTLSGRGLYLLTSSGKTFTQAITVSNPTGTYTQADALSTNGAFTLSIGGYNDGGFSFSCLNFVCTGSNTRALTLSGTTTVTITTTSNFWQLATTGLTLSHTGTIVCPTSTNTRTFVGGGATYGTLTYTVAGSTGELDITGNNSFAQINFSDASNARSLKFTAGTTQTIRNGNGFNVRGTAGKLMTIDTITGASTFTLTSSNVQSTDYLNINRSVVDVSPKWYAGANSTDNDTDTNWIYAAAPNISGGSGSGNGVMMSNRALLNIRNIM